MALEKQLFQSCSNSSLEKVSSQYSSALSLIEPVFSDNNFEYVVFPDPIKPWTILYIGLDIFSAKI